MAKRFAELIMHNNETVTGDWPFLPYSWLLKSMYPSESLEFATYV